MLYGLVVEGSPQPAAGVPVSVASVPPVSSSSPAGPSHQPLKPFFKCTLNKKNATDGMFNVKVVKARMIKSTNGKQVEFDKLKEVHISLDEHTANVHVVTGAAKNTWGSGYIVVTADGLEVDDSAGTQGI